MTVARREVFRRLVPGAAAGSILAARGREAWVGENRGGAYSAPPPSKPRAIRLNSNENPLGPSPRALDAIRTAFAYSGRYPMNARPAMADLRTHLAARHGVAQDQVALGAGSGELLDSAARAFTSSARALVAGLPTYEAPARVARRIGSGVVEVRVDDDGRLDLEKMIQAPAGAGLVFVCNPNNPTGTVHSEAAVADVVARIRKASPETVVLIDEAYHDYVTDPAYATAIPLAARLPNVLVTRTFSKAFGMAGLRIGYVVGHAVAVARLARWNMPYNVSAPAVAAALAAIDDDAQLAAERRRNTEARDFTTRFFRDAGMRVIESQTNFVWVDLGRPAQEFREACEKRGVLVGRAFPPFEKTHCRISIGTMEEMQRALAVFRTLLA